jgi:hypothetical protein
LATDWKSRAKASYRASKNGRKAKAEDWPEDQRGDQYQEGPPPEDEVLGLVLTCMASIQPKPVEWLVPGRLPLGKLMMLAGDGGLGKSTITLGITAGLTTGQPCFGLIYDAPAPCDVLLISCEDDAADTEIPRLIAAGADRKRIFKVDGIKGKDGKPLPFSLAHYDAMEKELEARPNVRLVIIDPAGAFIGRSGVDDHKDSELRSLLGPLSEVAARRRVTIILVKHLNKGVTAKAIHKVGGSTGYVNSCRAVFLVAPDPEEDGRILFLPMKFNIGPRPRGLACRSVSLSRGEWIARLGEFPDLSPEDRERLGGQMFRIEWLGEVDTDADSALADNARRDRGGNKVDQAAEWLVEFLAEYAYPSAEVFAAAEKAGFTRDNIYRAKGKVEGKVTASNRGAFQGAWHWGLGHYSTWRLRPETSESENTTPKSPNIVKFPNTGDPDLGDL